MIFLTFFFKFEIKLIGNCITLCQLYQSIANALYHPIATV